MHAVILAGGRGVRLRPYTTSIPKPLVPIGDEHSILEIVLMQLASQGFRSVTLAIGHFGHLIRSYVGDGSRWGLSVDYVQEESPLGTIGPLLPILDTLPEHFLVMNGDVLTDLSFSDLLAEHIGSQAPLTVATYARNVRIDFGVLEVNSSEIIGFREKPTLPIDVSMGVYGLTRATLERYEAGRPFGFDDLVLDLLDRHTPPRTHHFDGYWLDIGRPEDYDRANADFAMLRSALLPAQIPAQRSAPTAERSTRGRSRQAKRVLVVGGAGFLGRHVLADLAARDGTELTVLSRPGELGTGFPTVEMDIVEAGTVALQRVLQEMRPDAVINCAGAISGDLEALVRANLWLVSDLVDALIASGVPSRLVHIGSGAEYGPGTPGVPVGETTRARATSDYAVTKLAGTETVLSAAAAGRLPGVVLRVFNPLGPGAAASSLTGRVLAELDRVRIEGGCVHTGPLDASRDFIDVRDVATATSRAALLPGDVTGVYNVGRGQAVLVRRLVSTLCRAAGYDGEIVEDRSASPRSALVDWQCADTTRTRSTFGWFPSYELSDMVASVVRAAVPR